MIQHFKKKVSVSLIISPVINWYHMDTQGPSIAHP